MQRHTQTERPHKNPDFHLLVKIQWDFPGAGRIVSGVGYTYDWKWTDFDVYLQKLSAWRGFVTYPQKRFSRKKSRKAGRSSVDEGLIKLLHVLWLVVFFSDGLSIACAVPLPTDENIERWRRVERVEAHAALTCSTSAF